MKNLKGFLSLFICTVLLSAAIFIVGNGHVEAGTSNLIASTLTGSFYLATHFNIISLPAGILGTYIMGPGGGVTVISTEKERGELLSYESNPLYAGKKKFSSYLRSEALLQNGTNQIKFLINTGDLTSLTPTEKRLDRNDKFAITKLGFLWLKQPDGKTSGRLHAYPNLTDFTAAVAADLDAVYAGQLSVIVAGERFISGMDMQRFRRVPPTQQSAATNYDETNIDDQLVNMIPHLNLDGSSNTEISITYPSYAGWAAGTAPATFKHYLVMFAKGYLIQQGSSNI